MTKKFLILSLALLVGCEPVRTYNDGWCESHGPGWHFIDTIGSRSSRFYYACVHVDSTRRTPAEQ